MVLNLNKSRVFCKIGKLHLLLKFLKLIKIYHVILMTKPNIQIEPLSLVSQSTFSLTHGMAWNEATREALNTSVMEIKLSWPLHFQWSKPQYLATLKFVAPFRTQCTTVLQKIANPGMIKWFGVETMDLQDLSIL